MMRSDKIAKDIQRRFVMKRIISAILAIILLLCSLASCNDAQSEETSVETTLSIDETTAKPEKPEVPLNQTINIMCNTATIDLVEYLVKGFKSTVYGVKVNLTVLEDGRNGCEEKLAADVLAQNGPDIFIINDEIFFNTYDYIKSGVFADIDELNAVYDYLRWDNYNQDAMDYGIVDGKRVIFPIFYSFPILIGMKEVLDAEGIKYGDGVTFKEFAESCIASSMPVFDRPEYAYRFYRSVGLEVIDEKEGTADFESQEFRDFMECYVQLFPNIYNGGYNDLKISHKGYTNDLCGALLAEEVLFCSTDRYNYQNCNLPIIDTIITAIIENGNTPVITYVPTMDGQGVAARVEYALAINSNTQYPEACMQFLRYASSLEYCADDEWHRPLFINNKHREAIKDVFYGEELEVSADYKKRSYSFDYEDLDEEILGSYYSIINRLYFPKFVSTDPLRQVANISWEVDANGMSLDEAIKKYKKQLELILTE